MFESPLIVKLVTPSPFCDPPSRTPSTSSSRMIMYSLPSILMSEPEYLPNRMRSPALTSSGISLPSSSRLPLPTATTSPSCGFSLAESGMNSPPILFSLVFDPFDHDAVVERSNVHSSTSILGLLLEESLIFRCAGPWRKTAAAQRLLLAHSGEE